ncbi:MAG: hypothetical protein J6J65_00195 [Opitutales bacterium]|nr:hypothetical protein [Opitutales bacterium]
MMEFATYPEYSSPPTEASAPRGKNKTATPFKSPRKYFAGAFSFPVSLRMRAGFHTLPEPESNIRRTTRIWSFSRENPPNLRFNITRPQPAIFKWF